MRDIWFCKFCFRQSEIEHDGFNGFCVGCQTPIVRVRNSDDIFDTAWFPAAEAAISLIAPPYGAALRGLDDINDANPPQWLDSLINVAALAIIGIVGFGIVREFQRATS